jgi:hypothetical protein
MCEKCTELDRRIQHLKRMVEQLADQQTIAAASGMIKEMEDQKVRLHTDGS